MRHIIVKEGARQPSVFSDFIETVNASNDAQVGFFTRVDPGLRLVRNRTREDLNCAFALAHFQVDPSLPVQPRSHFHPIDTDLIANIADQHDFVMVGVVTHSAHVHDYRAMTEIKYIARDSAGFLVDITTNRRLQLDGNVTFFTAFFGFVRVQGFPAYYMILNPNLVHATDGFDYFQPETNTLWTLLSDHDGTLKESLFPPVVTGARLIGNTILTNQSQFNFSVLTSQTGVFRRENPGKLFDDSQWNINSNLGCEVSNGTFTIDSPPLGQVGFFELSLHAGLFFEVASEHERLTFKYVVHRYGSK